MRGSQILEAARLHRLGFPETVPINEFMRRFGLLCSDPAQKDLSVETILSSNEIDSSTYRIGPSQVSLVKILRLFRMLDLFEVSVNYPKLDLILKFLLKLL